jgi:hypothetical protein
LGFYTYDEVTLDTENLLVETVIPYPSSPEKMKLLTSYWLISRWKKTSMMLSHGIFHGKLPDTGRLVLKAENNRKRNYLWRVNSWFWQRIKARIGQRPVVLEEESVAGEPTLLIGKKRNWWWVFLNLFKTFNQRLKLGSIPKQNVCRYGDAKSMKRRDRAIVFIISWITSTKWVTYL